MRKGFCGIGSSIAIHIGKQSTGLRLPANSLHQVKSASAGGGRAEFRQGGHRGRANSRSLAENGRPSQRRIEPSLLVETRKSPSGLNVTKPTLLRCPRRETTSRPDPVSQTMIARSVPADAIRRPSGLNARQWTEPPCPLVASRCCPVAMSQIRTLPSTPPVARHRRSRLKAADSGRVSRLTRLTSFPLLASHCRNTPGPIELNVPSQPTA